MITIDAANEQGLRITDAGVEITLPIPVSQVEIRIGTFNRPLDIEALDSSRTIISQETVPLLNHYENRTVSAKGQEISMIRFIGGGHEGVLARICINILLGNC